MDTPSLVEGFKEGLMYPIRSMRQTFTELVSGLHGVGNDKALTSDTVSWTDELTRKGPGES